MTPPITIPTMAPAGSLRVPNVEESEAVDAVGELCDEEFDVTTAEATGSRGVVVALSVSDVGIENVENVVDVDVDSVVEVEVEVVVEDVRTSVDVVAAGVRVVRIVRVMGPVRVKPVSAKASGVWGIGKRFRWRARSARSTRRRNLECIIRDTVKNVLYPLAGTLEE